MATIKAADQITVLDVSDAYNVVLSSEAYTFLGDTQELRPVLNAQQMQQHIVVITCVLLLQ